MMGPRLKSAAIPQGRPLSILPCAREDVPLVTQARSTILTASIAALRQRGLVERYFGALPPQHRVTMRSLVAGTWVPIDLALVHYRACEAMALSGDEIEALGLDVAGRLHSTFLGTLLRATRGLGVGPWGGLKHYDRLWNRLFVGGAAWAFKLGPNEIRVEVHGLPLCEVPYFREAFRHLQLAGVQLFCKQVLLWPVPQLCGPTSLSYRVQWS
jgi:hypothetical protein